MKPTMLHRIFVTLVVCNAAATGIRISSSFETNKNKPKSEYKDLISVYAARNLEFGFPTESERQLALRNGHYKPDTPIPIDVDVFYPPDSASPVIFMTIPRFSDGVPYSLAYLTNQERPNGSEIQPYPRYDWHSSHGADCDGLTSVYRVQIDSCGQMWILDSGEIDYVQHCPPQIVVINILDGVLVHRYRLPSEVYKAKISRFVTPLVDIMDPAPLGVCKKAFVYMADPTGFGIVVYDVARNSSWRIENKFTYPHPKFANQTIAGESFELIEGTIGLTVTPKNLGLPRMLYFHSIAGEVEVALPLEVANDEDNWHIGDISASIDDFQVLGKRGVQCAPSAMTAHGFLLCGFLEPIGIFGWNIRTPYNRANQLLLAYNPDTLQFVSGLKVIRNPHGKDEVWMLSNRLQKAFGGTIDFREINYRIQRCGVDELLVGKKCKA